MPKTKEKKRWIGYVLYGILLTLVLLYVRFPSEMLRDYILEMSDQMQPEVHLSIDTVSPSFPFTLQIHDARIALKENVQKILFQADDVFIRPRFASLWREGYAFDFQCLAYKGELTGNIRFEEALMGNPFDMALEINGIQLDDTLNLKETLGFPITGVFNGTITYAAKGRFPGASTGDADIQALDCRLGLTQPILGLNALEFNEITAKLALDRQILQVKDIQLKGREMNGSLSGKVIMRRDIMVSRLDLRGTFEPFADLVKETGGSQDIFKLLGQQSRQGEYSFTIRGSFLKPRFRLM
jgi:type II secretion system protein N